MVGSISYLYSSLPTILLVTALGVSVTMISGMFIYRSITTPLDSIKSKVNEIARRNFDVEIAEANRCDELGDLARSISEMKRHLKEKDHQKDEFINIASHELRTPIQPIVSYVELAKRGVIPEAKAFEVIATEAMRLKRLADDILDVSRIEGKRLKLTMESFSINDTLQKIVEGSQASVKNNAIAITFASDIQREGYDRVYGDKYRIIQVVTNLVNNAVKFTKKGKIEVTTKSLDSGAAIEICINDTGPGIPDEMFPKLFEKFATMGVADGAQHGTGLGLFISKAIIDAHGGSIAGLNNKNGGATFRIILPSEQSGDSKVDEQRVNPVADVIESQKSGQTSPRDLAAPVLENQVQTTQSREKGRVIQAHVAGTAMADKSPKSQISQ